jgi:sRNA-binding regulator protein Hfq
MKTPNLGQQVKVFLKNDLCIDGIVKEWNKDNVILEKNSKMLIIYHPTETILMVEIEIGKSVPKETSPRQVQKAKLEEKFEEVKEQPTSDLKNKNLAQLKSLLNEEERKELSEKLSTHTITNEVKPVDYGLPKFLSLKST